MIWVTDHNGQVTYVSPEWIHVTGCSVADSLGDGWRRVVHPADLSEILRVFRAAIRAKASFTLQYRLKVGAGDYNWAVSGAVPSFDPDERFLGYLGSVTILGDQSAGLGVAGALGSFHPPPSHDLTIPHDTLDLVAEHLLMAHALLQEDGGRTVMPPLREAMLAVAYEIAAAETAHSRTH